LAAQQVQQEGGKVTREYPKNKRDLARRIAEIKSEITFLESIKTGARCDNCDAWTGRGCKRADGVEPPAEVQQTGCDEWNWDEIPF
jgi:hypothetical protein